MSIGMQPADAKAWFGAAPPDLTLVARGRGTDWLYGFPYSSLSTKIRRVRGA